MKGAEAERFAADWLGRQGLSIVERNWRCRFGEIDIIARDGKMLIFVEVRLRSRSDFGGAAASITPAKRERLLTAARSYLSTLATEPPCRFDAILIENGQPVWLKNIFD